MKYGSVAKRYATALLKIAADKGQVGEVYEGLKTLQLQFAEHSTLQIILNSPIVKAAKKKAVIDGVFQKLSINPMIKSLMYLLVDRERISILPVLVLLYRDMADDQLGRVRVRVKTVSELGNNQEKLTSVLTKVLGKKILLECETDPDLLGGLIVQVKDQVFDASLKSELAKIQESIANKAFA